MYPLVSVIIPTYKRPNTLDRAITSVLTQTYPNVEVIVVDDNNPDSIDRTLTETKMARYINEPRVFYVKHEQNKNGSAARNTGARAAKGEFLAFLDDDDEFLPKKIESQVVKLKSLSNEWGMCYNRCYSQKIGKSPREVQEKREGDLYLEALKQNLFINAGSNLLLRREVFEEIGGFNESFKRYQDVEFLLRLLRIRKMAYVNEFGLICHVHPANKSVNFDEVIKHYIDAFKTDIEALPEKDRKELYDRVNKLRFINYLHPNRDFRHAWMMISSCEISFLTAISILASKTSSYLINRLKSK